MTSAIAIDPVNGPVLRSVLLALLILCSGFLLGTGTASAQEFGRLHEQIASGTAYRIFARPGDATVQVVVVAAEGSGVYEVAPETDLGKLVALTGGPAASGAHETGRSRVTIRLLREDAGVRRAIYEAPLEQVLMEPGSHPTLLEGDVLAVETDTRQRFNWRDALTISTAVATLSWTLRAVLTGQ